MLLLISLSLVDLHSPSLSLSLSLSLLQAQGIAILVRSLLMKSRNGFARDVVNTLATYTGLVPHVPALFVYRWVQTEELSIVFSRVSNVNL